MYKFVIVNSICQIKDISEERKKECSRIEFTFAVYSTKRIYYHLFFLLCLDVCIRPIRRALHIGVINICVFKPSLLCYSLLCNVYHTYLDICI